MKYLKKFTTLDSFNDVKYELEYPTVSLTVEDDNSHWRVEPMGYVEATFETTVANETIPIVCTDNSAYLVTVDGTPYERVTGAGLDGYHEFTNPGIHVVKYYFDQDAKSLSYLFSKGIGSNVPCVSIDFSNFNSKYVKDMSYMLNNIGSKLQSITFGGLFTTKNVKDFTNMLNDYQGEIETFDINLEIIKHFDLSSAKSTNGMFIYKQGYHYFEKETIANMNVNGGYYVSADEVPFGYAEMNALNTEYAILEVDGKVEYIGYDITPKTAIDFTKFQTEEALYGEVYYRWIVKFDDSVNKVIAKNNMYLSDNITSIVGNMDYGLHVCECRNSGYHHTNDVYKKRAAQVFEFIGVGPSGCTKISTVLDDYPNSCYYYQNVELNNNGSFNNALSFSHNDVRFYNTNQNISYNCYYTDRINRDGEYTGVCADSGPVSVSTTSTSMGVGSSYYNSPI